MTPAERRIVAGVDRANAARDRGRPMPATKNTSVATVLLITALVLIALAVIF